MIQKFNERIENYFRLIDSGDFFKRPFKIIYSLIGLIILGIPFYLLYKIIDSNLLSNAPAKFSLVFVICWLILAIVSWISFKLWINRSDKVSISSQSGAEFVATPVYSHFIQTLGEWMGTYFGLLGFFYSLLAVIILGDDSYLISYLGLPFVDGGWEFVLLSPIIGFLIILTTRFLAEQFRGLASIANNTKR